MDVMADEHHERRRPGRKSGLLPRSPVVRRRPRLDNIDFAIDAVIEPLAAAGWSDDNYLARHGLNNKIAAIVADYVADKYGDRSNRVLLKELRDGVAKLGRDIDKLISPAGSMPDASRSAVDRVMAEALDRELDELDKEEAPDLEYIRAGLSALREATRRILAAERGAGPPADRIGLTLVRGLARIFGERTGKPASPSPNSRFAQFVAAINELIPKPFRLERFESLIAAAARSPN
jgi:hypothetical protein